MPAQRSPGCMACTPQLSSGAGRRVGSSECCTAGCMSERSDGVCMRALCTECSAHLLSAQVMLSVSSSSWASALRPDAAACMCPGHAGTKPVNTACVCPGTSQGGAGHEKVSELMHMQPRMPVCSCRGKAQMSPGGGSVAELKLRPAVLARTWPEKACMRAIRFVTLYVELPPSLTSCVLSCAGAGPVERLACR